MLLTDPAGRDDAPGREREGRPEDRLGHEDTLRMVAQRPVPKIRQDEFRGVEELVKGEIVLDRAAPFLHRGQRVVIRMCHRRPLRNHG